MKTFKIADDRLLKIAKKYDQLCIEEKGSAKSATFTPSRWASFPLSLDEINSQVEKLVAGENIAYRCHYGGGWSAKLLWDSRYIRHPIPFHFLLAIKFRSLLLGFLIADSCRMFRIVAFILSAILIVDIVAWQPAY